MRHHGSASREHKHCCCRDKGPAVRGFLIPCLMVLLREAPAHGYQLIERLEQSGYMKETPDPGVVYRHLRHLEKDAMVTSSFEPGDGPARKVYTITDEGRAELGTWLDELAHLKQHLEIFLGDALKG